MFHSTIFSVLIIYGLIIAKVSSGHIKKEEICSVLKNIELEVPCSKLETSFLPNNCTSPEECMDKEKLDDCLHGLIFNGTKYTEDNECLQFYCKCFDGMTLVTHLNESDSEPKNSTLDADTECENCTETEITTTTTTVTVTPENLVNHTEAADMSDPDEMVFVSEDVDSNHTEVGNENGTETSKILQQSGKYIQSAGTQPPQLTGNQRSGSRKPDYSTTTHYTQETSTKNIYDRNDEEDLGSKNRNVMNPHANDQNHHDASESVDHHNAHSNASLPSRKISVQALLIAFFTSFFFSFSTFFLFFLSIGNFL